ncbi:MAG TPA: choice-of-anchor Q domain-containing protein [Candidatus Binatia bacterium]|jgi:hypothetical protein|nr:choice-of-anchor Q domain-containing protein [Candidatus Binatia bacterium]
MIRLALLLCAALAAIAHADLLTFPGCGATLQACLDDAETGDTVQIISDVPAAEALVVKRGVTLEGAPGGMPKLAFGTTLTMTPEGDAPTSFTVRNLELRGGWIDVTHDLPADLTVTITGNRFVHGGPTPIVRVGEPVKVPNDPYGVLTAVITDNTLVADGADTSQGILVNAHYAARMSVAILRNTLEVLGTGQFGIGIDASTASADVDVIGNRISGEAYDTGVTIFHFDGTMHARVVGNVVTGQDGDGGVYEALAVGTEDGDSVVLVANNSVAGNRTGLAVGTSGTGTMHGVVANNLVVGNTDRGLVVPPSIPNRNNLIFANGLDAFVPEPGTRLADPRFEPGTLRLRPDSPARDAGATDVVPTDVATDADGNPRVAGPAVDIGAFEVPCPECAPEDPPAGSCDDGDPCTLDAADGTTCTHAPATGLSALACTCQRAPAAACAGRELPNGVSKKTARACTVVASTDARKAIRRATRQWTGALRQAQTRATRRRLGTECADALASALGDTVARARSFLTAP